MDGSPETLKGNIYIYTPKTRPISENDTNVLHNWIPMTESMGWTVYLPRMIDFVYGLHV